MMMITHPHLEWNGWKPPANFELQKQEGYAAPGCAQQVDDNQQMFDCSQVQDIWPHLLESPKQHLVGFLLPPYQWSQEKNKFSDDHYKPKYSKKIASHHQCSTGSGDDGCCTYVSFFYHCWRRLLSKNPLKFVTISMPLTVWLAASNVNRAIAFCSPSFGSDCDPQT